MTLAQSKKHLKIISIVAFLAIYGTAFYQLGKSASITEIVKVKGASTKEDLRTPVESPIPYADTQSAKIFSSYAKICSNTVYGVNLSYPKDWFTTYNSEEEKCTFFAPYSFVVPYETSNFLVPITINSIKPQEWLETVKYYENPNDFYNVKSSESIEIQGKSAKKIEASTTGSGYLERGLIKTTYLIFDSRLPLAVSYQQLEKNEDIEESKNILNDIVHSISLF